MGRALAAAALAIWAATATSAAHAQISPKMEGYEVEVAFTSSIERYLPRIDNIEQILEERFRRNRTDQINRRDTIIHRFARELTEGTIWAGERLIPDVEDYTVVNLLKALTADNINRAVPGFRGQVLYEIRRLKISDHSLAFLQGSSSYVIGRVVVVGEEGTPIIADKVYANLVVDPTVDRQYTGPKYAFLETEDADRVGPTLAYFVEKALERAWPDKKDEIHGPVLIRVSGPDEHIVEGGF